MKIHSGNKTYLERQPRHMEGSTKLEGEDIGRHLGRIERKTYLGKEAKHMEGNAKYMKGRDEERHEDIMEDIQADME